jgi:putative membrane protein
MTTDLVLAILHHIAVFGLVAHIMAEAVLLRPGIGAAEIGRLARLDRAYGGTAGAVVIIGILRVIFGIRGYEYYVWNPWFWAKMASFAVIALLSIPPTRKFVAWSRAAKLDPAFVPAADEVRLMQRLLRAESAMVVLVVGFAATMARFN